jgi:hypothetical protein
MTQKIAAHALLAGCCALVPLPILDTWLERKATRRMYTFLLESSGKTLDDAALDLLVEDRSSLLLGCLSVVVIWPLKKLFRTFFYFLTIKDVIDGTAEAAIRAAMLEVSYTRLPHDAKGVRDVMDATLEKWRFSPVTRFLTRGERPPTTWLAASDWAGRTVGWLYGHAGGGAILEDYKKRLEALP